MSQRQRERSVSIIIDKVVQIKKDIQNETIEKFPDSERLSLFLNIISLFNDKEESSMSILFDYILETAYPDVKTIAKITLANNLLISESEENSDFIFKNLQLIYDYILKDFIEKFKIEGNQQALEINESKLQELELEKNDDRAVKHSTMKNIGAFANSDGGNVLIGVADNKEILGLDNDFNRNKKEDKLDEFNKDFDALLTDYIGNHIHRHIKPDFVEIDGKQIFLITIQVSNHVIL